MKTIGYKYNFANAASVLSLNIKKYRTKHWIRQPKLWNEERNGKEKENFPGTM
jgi:hypothetical protein